MDDKDRLIAVGTAAILAGTIAIFFATRTGTVAPVLMWIFAGLAIAGFIALPWSWYPQSLSWLRSHLVTRLAPRSLNRHGAQTLLAAANCWRFTTDGAAVPQIRRDVERNIDHPSYMRPTDSASPFIRVILLVACGPLGDVPGSQEMRGSFLTWQVQAPATALVRDLCTIPEGLTWKSWATARRSNLRADLTGEDQDQVPVASAFLELPSTGPRLAGTDPRYAELILHIDLPTSDFAPGLPDWRRRFTWALAMPGELARFLQGLGLAVPNEPPAQVGVLLHARQSITELVSPGNIPALPASSSQIVNEFIGFAVAAPDGKTAEETAGQMVLDLSERDLHLNGSPGEMSGEVVSAAAPPAWQAAAPLRRKDAELRTLYIEARAKLRLGHFDAAIGMLDDLLTLDPGYNDAAALRDTARRARQLADAYMLAGAAEKAGDWIVAIKGYSEILLIDPDYRNTAARRDMCQVRQDVADLQGELRYLARLSQWQAVLDVDTEITRLDPAGADLEGLVTRARAILAAGKRAVHSSACRVVAAIDFGTYGTGFAWTTISQDNSDMAGRRISFFHDWEDQQLNYPKNRSAILLDPESQPLSWGYQALAQIDAMHGSAGWNLQTGFKLSLQSERGEAAIIGSDTGVVVATDATDAFRLTVLCLQQVVAIARDQINRAAYQESDIRWCVTVPAIWDQYTRDLMFKAAVEAGLPNDPDRLLLVQEPAAAALYCVAKGELALSTPGTRFLVVDAGGGTVDITCYRTTKDGRLAELAPASGVKAGSEYLDKAFVEEVLGRRFGVGTIVRILTEHRGAISTTMDAWGQAKRGFSPDSNDDLLIPISAPLYEALVKEHRADRWDGSGEPVTEMVVGHDLVASLFDQLIEEIIPCVKRQLREMRSVTGDVGGEIALLVGGFAESPYLQARLGEWLTERGVRIVVPDWPSVAVLAGAVHFCYNPSVFITSRAPFTVGVGIALPFRPGRDPEDKKIIGDEGRELCSDRFAVFVANREAVLTDKPITRIYSPFHESQTDITIQLFSTVKADPEYITDPGVEVLGSLTIDLSDSMNLPMTERKIEVAMYFGQTQIRVEARNIHTGRAQSVVIQWHSTW